MVVTVDFMVINNNLPRMPKYNNILTLGIKVLSHGTSSSVEYNTGTYERSYEPTYVFIIITICFGDNVESLK